MNALSNPRTRLVAVLALVTLPMVAAGCANSVLNDPEEMARRHASVERDIARRNAFWGRFGGGGSGTTSEAPRSSPGLYQVGITSPSACRAAGGTWNTASNFCWRL